MDHFIPGQRWSSDTESQMGLGTVVSVDQRSVTITFFATGETRTYAKQTAPLTRVKFEPGDSVPCHNNQVLKITASKEHDGLITYFGTIKGGEEIELEEGQLDNFIQLNRPGDRLLSGKIDHDKWFELRYLTLEHINRLAHSAIYGFAGGRTSLIPHQLYIAHEVANRYAPRVLLADEVGLGKTIEAGLILHQQLLTERARRVLIVVPETLLHQWLVEMLRRFNLNFSIFDPERCTALEESEPDNNPFHSEQLVLCSLEFLSSNPKWFKQAFLGAWDLLVVDEAHHLQWTPEQASLEYELIELLAEETSGVLLLTATPEQLGKASHFARLRLLDPDRFSDFEAFSEEEKHYEPISKAIAELLNEQPLDQDVLETLRNTVSEGDNLVLIDALQNKNSSNQEQLDARKELIEHLLDRHGTGRVLFRNTRAVVKGFPDRKVSAYALSLPSVYAECIAAFQTNAPEPQQLLSPELLYQQATNHPQAHWTQVDPRVEWLTEKLAQLKPDKVLVITASAHTALDLSDHLRTKTGMVAAVFHEGLTIIERDRAAAFFADQEYGSQILICSEIGSEGRNFQFAHHLILFDLPLNPDLLEQRIGRLDRIGQTETVEIHVPYIKNSAQAIMYAWYHHGLCAFEHTCPAGHSVYTQVEDTLIEALHQVNEGLDALISKTQGLLQEMNAALQRGRDRLLEYNSCRPHIAKSLQEQISQQDSEPDLAKYLELIFDCFAIDTEYHSETATVLTPSDHMQTSHFPGLQDEGMTVTYDRETALANEDMHFLTWEHPLVTGAMDRVLSSELGNTAISAIKLKGLRPGIMLLECLYVMETASAEELHTSRYLPPTTIRVVVDKSGNNYDATLSHELIKKKRCEIDAETANEIVRSHAQEIRALIKISNRVAHEQAPSILAAAHQATKHTLKGEINRLKALSQINPNIRKEEIQFFETQLSQLTQVLESADLRLDAVRIIVST